MPRSACRRSTALVDALPNARAHLPSASSAPSSPNGTMRSDGPVLTTFVNRRYRATLVATRVHIAKGTPRENAGSLPVIPPLSHAGQARAAQPKPPRRVEDDRNSTSSRRCGVYRVERSPRARSRQPL